MTGPLFDPGLQPERTDLAWRRTTISIGIGAIVALRVLPGTLGAWAISVGLAGVALAPLLWVLARAPAQKTRQALLHKNGPLPGGGILLLLTVISTAGVALGLLDVAFTDGGSTAGRVDRVIGHPDRPGRTVHRDHPP